MSRLVAPRCRFCASPLGPPVIDLGEQPLANANLLPGEEASERRFPLVVRPCPQCLLVQAAHDLPADAIFTEDYAYFSSTSVSWVAHAKIYAQAMIARFGLGPHSLVAEIASNDGYLLQHFQAAGIPVLGVEPTRNTAQAAIARGIDTHIAFFGRNTARELAGLGRAADLIAANNVLAHVPDLADFCAGFALLLKPEGVATFEFPHLLSQITQGQFDTIYHEHYSYLSLLAVAGIFAKAGMRVFDVEALVTHGGSLRVFACRDGARHEATARVAAQLAAERQAGLDRPEGPAFRDFAKNAARARADFLAFLREAKAGGKIVAGYGAAAKGNTFLNFCGIGRADLALVADASPAKQGKLMPGSHVPIVAPPALLALRPDYVVILPWNLADEIAGQLAPIRAWNGQFVTAIPHLRIF